jgi:RsiW-degrading membrane proteinase PrsW (M82 family)
MPYPFQKPSQDVSDGSIGMAFRVTAAFLAGVAVLLFCLIETDAGLGGATAWLLAAASAGAVFLLAQSLVAAIMVALAPVLIIAVVVRFVLG